MKTHYVIKLLLIGAVTSVPYLGLAYSQEAALVAASRSTPDHWNDAGWWPTKGASARAEYAGAGACTKCHASIAAEQAKTPMFSAASLPADAPVLQQHKQLQFWEPGYSYALTRQADETTLTVKGETGSITGIIGWAFGLGEVAQTYILKQADTFLESRVSFYPSLQKLDITPGHSAEVPESIGQTLGDPIDAETTPRCFGCHSTASTVSGNFEPEHAALGVHCEACHGPGVKHVQAMKTSPGTSSKNIFNPELLSPVDSVDFCGACHRTPVDVAVYMPRNMGVTAVRFQPYRLEKSFCWGTSGDAKLTCIACHDPHKPLEHELSAYDANCLKCHAATGAAASATRVAACKVGARNCASCHMPKYEVRWIHGTFTDHYIRIVRPGSSFRE